MWTAVKDTRTMATLTVVVPIFQEQSCLDELTSRVMASIEPLSDDARMLLVDDGSADGSWDRIMALAEADTRVQGIRLDRNYGQSQAITCGLQHADSDWVVVMDGDLQDRPEEIPRLFDKAQEGYEMVLARKKRRRHPLLHRTLIACFYWLLNRITDTPYDSGVGNFRVMSRRCVDYVLSRGQRVWIFTLAGWTGLPNATIDVTHDARFAGDTSYSFPRRVRMALDAILLHSEQAFWWSLALGIGLVVAAISGACVTLALAPEHLLSWPGMFCLVGGLGGVMIAHLGVVGVYVARLSDEVRAPPLFQVSERTTPTTAVDGNILSG
jgi:glycosyltransferase involved in cell wall biosynthesis